MKSGYLKYGLVTEGNSFECILKGRTLNALANSLQVGHFAAHKVDNAGRKDETGEHREQTGNACEIKHTYS